MRVLFLTHRLPYAPNRGDRVRAWFMLRALRQHAAVDIVSLVHDDEEAAQAGALAGLAATVRVVRVPRWWNLVRSVAALPTSRPTTHSMLDAPGLMKALGEVVTAHPPDVVLAYCSGMARLAMVPPLSSFPFVLDMVDVDSAKWAALSKVTRPPKSWVYRREAHLLGRFEVEASRAASATLVVTPGERTTLTAMAPDARIVVVENGVDTAALHPPSDAPASTTVVFCGVMNYEPNEKAAELLAREVWPIVGRARPDARLQIVGSNPSARVRALARDEHGIEVTGAVPDVRPYLWSAAVAAAPLFTARGIQNKVLEAVAAGLPTVVTPNIMASLPDEVRPACVSADSAGVIAREILSLLELTPVQRRERAGRANLAALTWDTRLSLLPQVLEGAVAAGRRAGVPA